MAVLKKQFRSAFLLPTSATFLSVSFEFSYFYLLLIRSFEISFETKFVRENNAAESGRKWKKGGKRRKDLN